MWKYKYLLLITIISIALSVSAYVRQALQVFPDPLTLKMWDTLTFAAHLLCIFTLVIVLRKHRESKWRSIPFYALTVGSVLINYAVPIITQSLRPKIGDHIGVNNYAMFFGFIGLYYLSLYIYLIISCFLVKSPAIARYFKFYSAVTMLAAVLSVALRFVLQLTLRSAKVIYLEDVIILLPALTILWMHYNLYIKYEFFKTGNTVIITVEHENIPQGALGTIVQKHNSSFFDVEFLDDNGNLLNVISLSADDFEHAALPDLETRVENFGSQTT